MGQRWGAAAASSSFVLLALVLVWGSLPSSAKARSSFFLLLSLQPSERRFPSIRLSSCVPPPSALQVDEARIKALIANMTLLEKVPTFRFNRNLISFHLIL
jgi:hypothetical protein